MMCDTERRSKPLPPKEVARLYRKHGPTLIAHARRMLGDATEAHDVMHEVFARLLSDAPILRAQEAIGRWLRGAATFACFKRKRADATERRVLARTLETEEDPRSFIAELRLEARQVLERMPSDMRGLAVQYYLREMTQEEIAATIGCSRRNVGYQLDRLKRALKTAPMS
jgi:RNA polymerase sigma-70 factor (ECF subfamily)